MTQPLPGPSHDLSGHLRRFSASRLPLEDLDAYYRGDQRPAWLPLAQQQRHRTPVVNLPRLVVDSLEDRLDVEGFRMGGSEDADADLWTLWQANDLDEWSQQCHLDALIHGRAFVIVWANDEDPRTPRITVESALQMHVEYDPATRQVTRAVKRWVEGREQFATVYEPDRIMRYIAAAGTPDDASTWRQRAVPILNPLGIVPVVPFVNRPRTSAPLGESEMTDVLPIADSINELVDAMMISARYHAMPRRYATGIDLGSGDVSAERVAELVRQRWQEAEAGRVWLSDSPQTSFGQFAEASLDNYIGAIDMLTARGAALAGLPPHFFGQVGENPASADALRASESSLVKKALRKQRVFGGAWERVMRMALLVRDGSVPEPALSMETLWRDAETPTIAQKADAAVKLVQADVIDGPQALEDLGYTPVQIERLAKRRAEAITAVERARVDYANELERTQGLTKNAALATAGLTIAAGLNAQQ